MAGSALWQSSDLAEWHRAYSQYAACISAAAVGKKEKLKGLDEWYLIGLPGAINSRGSEKCITSAELAKLVEWKLTRGKWRPRLQQLAESNLDEQVRAATKAAFAAMPDVKRALKEVSELKGVGPATSSAVLAAGAPDQAAFASDEAMDACGIGSIQYTAPFILKYIDVMCAKATELNNIASLTRSKSTFTHSQSSASSVAMAGVLKRDGSGFSAKDSVVWTPVRVEMALFADVRSRAAQTAPKQPSRAKGATTAAKKGDKQTKDVKKTKGSAASNVKTAVTVVDDNSDHAAAPASTQSTPKRRRVS